VPCRSSMRARDRDRPACTLSCSHGFLQGSRDPCFESFVTRVGHGDQRSVLPPPKGFNMLESQRLDKYDTRNSTVIHLSSALRTAMPLIIRTYTVVTFLTMIIYRYLNCRGRAENSMIAVLSMSMYSFSNTAVKNGSMKQCCMI